MTALLSLLALLSLNGVWLQACHNGYSRSEFFSGLAAVYVERNFWDGACTQPSVITTSRGAIEPGPALAVPAKAYALDFTFESVTLRPVSNSSAVAWQQRGVCGIHDWRVGEEREVTGRDCDFSGLGSVTRVPAKGERRYGLVKVAKGALYFGQLSPERDGVEPGRRPEVLDPLPYRPVP